MSNTETDTTQAALTVEWLPVDSVHQYHLNPRRGVVKVIQESLERLGQYKPITVNRGTLTGRPDEILAGNHTWAAIRNLKWPQVAVSWVDVDDETAAVIVAVDNRTSDLAKNDPGALAELLGGLDDLQGTGYTQADLDKILEGLDLSGDADIDDQVDQTWQIIVTCHDESHQALLLQRFADEGLEVRALL